MKEIEMDFHDGESSFDIGMESEYQPFENNFEDSDEEMEIEKELVFYRRLDDF